MRYQNNFRQTLKAAAILSFIALVSGFVLNGASITFTPNKHNYTPSQPIKANISTYDKSYAESNAYRPLSPVSGYPHLISFMHLPMARDPYLTMRDNLVYSNTSTPVMRVDTPHQRNQ